MPDFFGAPLASCCVVGISQYGPYTVAGTVDIDEPGAVPWWHVWTPAGHYLGAASDPELLGDLIAYGS